MKRAFLTDYKKYSPSELLKLDNFNLRSQSYTRDNLGIKSRNKLYCLNAVQSAH